MDEDERGPSRRQASSAQSGMSDHTHEANVAAAIDRSIAVSLVANKNNEVEVRLNVSRAQPTGKALLARGEEADSAAGATVMGAWRETANLGAVLTALYEEFGEGLLPYIPSLQLTVTL